MTDYQPFDNPVPTPPGEPDGNDSVQICFARGWRAYILGALAVLADKNIYEGNDEQIELAVKRASLLLAMVSEAEDCEEPMNIQFKNNPTNCTVLQMSIDGGANFFDTEYDPAACAALIEQGDIKLQNKPNDPNFTLQLSLDGGANYTDTTYSLTGYADNFIRRSPTGTQNTITTPSNAVALRVQSSDALNEFVPVVIDMPFSTTNTAPLLSVRGRNNLFNTVVNAAGHVALSFASGSLPTATAQYRGSVVARAVGDDFEFYVCVPNAAGTSFAWHELARQGTDGIDGIDGIDGTIITDAIATSLSSGAQPTATLINHPTVTGTKRLVVGIPAPVNGIDGIDGADAITNLIINPIDQNLDQTGTWDLSALTLNLHKAITNDAPLPTVEPGEDTACNQAAALVKQVQDFWTITSNSIDAAASFTSTVYAVASFLSSLPSLGFPNLLSGALDAVGAVVSGVSGFGVSVIDAALTNSAYDELKCLIYCAIGSNAQFTETELTELRTDIDDSSVLGSPAKFIFDSYLALAGLNRVNGAHLAYAVTGEDCSACDCVEVVPGVYDFVGGQRGWRVLPENEKIDIFWGGDYNAGWMPVTVLGFPALVIISPTKSWDLTRAEFFWSGVTSSTQMRLFKIGGPGGNGQISSINATTAAGSRVAVFDTANGFPGGVQCDNLLMIMDKVGGSPDWKFTKIVLNGAVI